MTTRDVTLLHASDVHIDAAEEGLEGLVRAVDAALAHDVDMVLLVGDTFDDGRPSAAMLVAFADQLARLTVPVVVLPGNHDMCMPGSLWERAAVPEHVHVLTGVEASLALPALDVELWARPHVSYADYLPLADPPPRGAARWQLALAHGHLVRHPEDHHRAYQITSADLAATQRDYVALGHWDVPHDASVDDVTAWYSGSPRRFRSSLLVTLPAVGDRPIVERLVLP